MTAAVLQITEKIALLKNKEALLTCDLNSVFSCSNVLNAWQSSVFGFPNSIMCLILFTTFTTSAVVGLTGGRLSRNYRIGAQALSLMTVGFALWFLSQSVYVINALCVLCIFCFVGLLFINWSWLRMNVTDLPVGEKARGVLTRAVEHGADTFIWILIALAVFFAMIIRFY